MMSWGLAMNGLGTQIEPIVRDTQSKFDPLTYLEIGIGFGETLCEITKILKSTKGTWRTVGCQLPNGYDFDKGQVEQNFGGQHLTVAWIKPNGWSQVSPVWNRVSVVMSDARDFFEGIWKEPIHLAMIDACHCKECVMRDFLNVEKFMPAGGTVLMHDFDMLNAPQPHGGQCDVIGACKELGLLDKRDGWALPRVLAADHSAGGWNMLAVTKEN